MDQAIIFLSLAGVNRVFRIRLLRISTKPNIPYVEWLVGYVEEKEDKVAIGKGVIIASKAVRKLLYEVGWAEALQACFTLALILRDEGWTKEEALDVMNHWNEHNCELVGEPKIRRGVEQAYSSDKEKASWKWIELLSSEEVEPKIRELLSDLNLGSMGKRGIIKLDDRRKAASSLDRKREKDKEGEKGEPKGAS